ncbi:MAG: hypothetical protein WD689_08195 [Gaiellaceae bacterium]
MRRATCLLAVLVALLAQGASARPAADCTQAQKTKAVAALAAFKQKVKGKRLTAAQRTRLAALKRAVACTVQPDAATGYAAQLAAPGWVGDMSFPTTMPHLGQWTPINSQYHPSGTLRVLIVGVDYPDAAIGYAPQAYHDAHAARAEEWYRNASYGRLSLDVTVLDKTYRLSRPIADYGFPGGRDQRVAFLREVVGLADGDVDFSKVDVLLTAGPDHPAARGIHVLGTYPGQGVTADGRELRYAIFSNGAFRDYGFPPKPLNDDQARVRATHGAITHELGHVLGLQDVYYKTPEGRNTWELVGGWDMMSDTTPGADFLAWHKYRLGWLEPRHLRGLEATGSLEETLVPIEIAGGRKAVVVPVSSTFLYVVEARRKTGVDATLCDEGVLVYTVDSTKSNAAGSIDVKAARDGDDPYCGPKAFAAFGAGETYEDGVVKVEVLSGAAAGYRVRVTRK